MCTQVLHDPEDGERHECKAGGGEHGCKFPVTERGVHRREVAQQRCQPDTGERDTSKVQHDELQRDRRAGHAVLTRQP